MSEGQFDELKGRAKEAAGDLTDDEDLEREGKVDKATGEAKQKADSVIDKVRDKAEDALDKVKDLISRDR
jgi:uncharacterized protein YjbJ (UPF0337 family)